jgi:hypothetical protein
MDPHHQVKQYEAAALVHDQAAEFWERRGRPDKATVEREADATQHGSMCRIAAAAPFV